MSTRNRWVILILLAVLLSPLLILILPRARTAARLVSGFEPLAADPRVWYEPGAEEYASQLAEALPEAVRRVEALQPLPFEPGFRVYVTATHQRFMELIGQAPRIPVRGITFPWDVWISPRAFDFFGSDTHLQTLTHELSHLHLKHHSGRFGGRRNLPSWFCEGLANQAADMGFDRISREDAVEALISGRHFQPDTEGRFLLKDAAQYGITWPLLHSQSRLFLDYLRVRDPEALGRHLLALFDGEDFGESFAEHYGENLGAVWSDFLFNLQRSHRRPGIPGEGPPDRRAR